MTDAEVLNHLVTWANTSIAITAENYQSGYLVVRCGRKCHCDYSAWKAIHDLQKAYCL